jgi:hypothetical protein
MKRGVVGKIRKDLGAYDAWSREPINLSMHERPPRIPQFKPQGNFVSPPSDKEIFPWTDLKLARQVKAMLYV